MIFPAKKSHVMSQFKLLASFFLTASIYLSQRIFLARASSSITTQEKAKLQQVSAETIYLIKALVDFSFLIKRVLK